MASIAWRSLAWGPGHTRGDSIAYLPKEKILFTGDLCVNFAGNNIADPDADPDNWLRVLDDLTQKDVRIPDPRPRRQRDDRELCAGSAPTWRI